MKKIVSVIMAVITVSAVCCACGKQEEIKEEKYIGEGLLSVLTKEVDANQRFYNDVFVLGHLETDETDKIEKDGKTYVAVNDFYKTYDELRESLLGIYTKECVENILTKYNWYCDIDGKLYFDKSAEDTISKAKGIKWERDYMEKIELEGKTDTSYTLEFHFINDKKDEMDEFTFVLVSSGNYRLTELQYVD